MRAMGKKLLSNLLAVSLATGLGLVATAYTQAKKACCPCERACATKNAPASGRCCLSAPTQALSFHSPSRTEWAAPASMRWTGPSFVAIRTSAGRETYFTADTLSAVYSPRAPPLA